MKYDDVNPFKCINEVVLYMTSHNKRIIKGASLNSPSLYLIHIDSLPLSTGLQASDEGNSIAGLALELPVADQHGYENSLARDVHPGRDAIQSVDMPREYVRILR